LGISIAFAERNPDVRVCIAHTARFEKTVLEKAAKLENCFVDFSAFVIHCKLAAQNSHHIAANEKRYKADFTNPVEVMTSIAETYQENMLWGTDTPFYYWIQKYHDSDGKLVEDRLDCKFDEEIKVLKSLHDELQKKISYSNTLHFLFGNKVT